jgi:hypothetical protein
VGRNGAELARSRMGVASEAQRLLRIYEEL